MAGVFDSAEITEEDLRAGLFDGAEVRVFLVNWADPSQGALKLRRGWLGEVVATERGVFRAELRGLVQALSQTVGELFTPECRADLGDARCRVPIWPPEVQRSTAYAVGTYVRVRTLGTASAAGTTIPLTIQNPSFEADGAQDPVTPTGWTVVSGTWTTWASNAGTVAFDGGYFLEGRDPGELYQDIGLVAQGADAAKLDAGLYRLDFSIWRANSYASDRGRVVVEARDGAGTLLATLMDAGPEEISPQDTWRERALKDEYLPSGTRTLRIRLLTELISGQRANACFDVVSATLKEGPENGYIVLPVVNRSFEADGVGDPASVRGWTVDSGAWVIRDQDNGGLVPAHGGCFLMGGMAASSRIRQEVNLTGMLDPVKIDAGDYVLTFQVQRANDYPLDRGRVLVEVLDASNTVIATPLDTGFEEIVPEDTWVARSFTDWPLPAGARTVRIVFEAERVDGNYPNACFDDVRLLAKDVSGSSSGPTTSEVYENRIYRCVTAGTTAATQPVYDTTPGNDTTDGTAVFRCEEAWTRHAQVASVTDRRTFTITVDEPRAADGWFTGGIVVFETGANAGVALEVKTWTQSGSQVELYLPAPFDVAVGDRLRISPGCDKRLATCKAKFSNVLNFRGEPFVPGADEMAKYPDAR